MSNQKDAKSEQVSKNREEAEGHRDEFSQRAHRTHLKVEEELHKAANSNSTDPATVQSASKGVMKREKVQSENPEADEDEVKERVHAEGNNNKTEESTQQAKEEQHQEATHVIQAERQKDLALKKAAAVFDNYHKQTHSASHTTDSHKDKDEPTVEDKADDVKAAASSKKDAAVDRLTDMKDQVKDKAEDVKDRVSEETDRARVKVGAWKDEAMEKGEELKEAAVEKYHAAIDTANEWKDAALQKGQHVKDAVAGQLQHTKETVKDTDVREKATELQAQATEKKEQLKQAASEQSEQVKEKASEMSDKARTHYQSAAQTVKDEAAHLQQVAGSTLTSVQQSAVHNASIIATQAQKAKDGIVNAVSNEAGHIKDTVNQWTGAVHDKIDEYRSEGGQGAKEGEEWRKEDGGEEQHETLTEKVQHETAVLTEKAQAMWQRGVSSSGPDVGRAPEVSSVDDSTSSSSSSSSSSTIDLSSSAAPELGHRVPSLYTGFDGLRGEDEGMGDGARLAAMVQDMSEY